jgi:hypothetical protein
MQKKEDENNVLDLFNGGGGKSRGKVKPNKGGRVEYGNKKGRYTWIPVRPRESMHRLCL